MKKDTRDVLKTGEKPLSPEATRVDVINHATGYITVALNSQGVLNQDLPPLIGGHVDVAYEDRQRHQLGMAPLGQQVELDPVATQPKNEVTANDEYLDAIAAEATITDISPAARNAVMGTSVDFDSLQEAA
jgi:hypothetical protein